MYDTALEAKKGGIFIKTKMRKALLAVVMLCMIFSMGTVQAKAAAKNVVTSAKKATGGSWEETEDGVRYLQKNGKYAKNAWLNIDGSIYRFDGEGYRETGWITYEDKSYYAGTNGKLYVKKWLAEEKDRYYFQASGACAKSTWLTIGGKQYYFLKTGKMAKSQFVTTSKKTYYVNDSGVRVKNTTYKIKDKQYHFDKNGVRIEKTWVKLKGKYYYFGTNGVMSVNKWVGKYYVGETGARKTNCVQDGYYLNASGKKTVKAFYGSYIFVGDSRMVGMKKSIAPANTKYIAVNGMGYNWLKNTAGVNLKYYLKANPNLKVVLALGVNDLGNVSQYISYYKKLIKEFPKTKFYMLSINPVDEAKEAKYGYSVKNSQIESFNKKMYSAFKSRYVNAYKYLKTDGFSTRDGLHYTTTVYKKLYKFIVGKIK